MFFTNFKKRLERVEAEARKSRVLIEQLATENIYMNKQARETTKNLTDFEEKLANITQQVKEIDKTCSEISKCLAAIAAHNEEFTTKFETLQDDFNHTKRIVVYKRKKYQDKVTTEE